MSILHSARLRLVPMDESHLDGLHAMNADPQVMRYLGGQPETREQTLAMIHRVQARWAEWGRSWWSFLDRESGEIVGAGCIQYLGRDRANPHEIGWRLRRDRWGQGLALEAARTMAGHAFGPLQAPLLRAICNPDNAASARVMQRLGMRRCGIERWNDEDCLCYEMSREDWQRALDTPPSP